MASAPYDSLETVEQAARVRMNDAIQLISGEIYTDLAAFTPLIVNNSWRRLQEFLSGRGFAALDRETILSSVPAWTATDPGTFVWFDWSHYFDGMAQQSAPVLPQDMIAPLDVWERVHGLSGTAAYFRPMDQVFNGLPTLVLETSVRDALNRVWEWRQERIWMPGATGVTDIRMRYAAFISDFLIGAQDTLSGNINSAVTTIPLASGLTIANGTVGSGAYIQIDSEIMLVTAGGGTNSQTATRGVLGTTAAAHVSGATVYVLGIGIAVTIMRSLNSLAWYMCSELSRARGDLDAGQFDTFAMDAAQEIWNRDYRQGRKLYKRAELGKVPDQETRQQGANMPAGPVRIGGNAA